MVRQEDKAKIRNVKVITSEECVPKHKLLVMDMRLKATKRRRRKFQPRVRVWKFILGVKLSRNVKNGPRSLFRF